MKPMFAMLAVVLLAAQSLVAAPAAGAAGPCLSAGAGQKTASTDVAGLAAGAALLDVRAVLVPPQWTEWIAPPRYPFDMLAEVTWQAALQEVGVWVPLADPAAVASAKLRSEFFASVKKANAAGVVIDPAAVPADKPAAARKAIADEAAKAGIAVDFQPLPAGGSGGPVVSRLAKGVVASSTLCILPVTPEEVMGTPAADVVRALPDTWKYARPIPLKEPEGAGAIARFGNGVWVVAVSAGGKELKAEIALDFLGKGPYVAAIVQDGKDGMACESKTVQGDAPMTVTLAPNCGLVAVMSKLAMSPAGGSFTALRRVELKSADPAAEIRYTTDGSVPGANSAKYAAPISLTKSSVLRATIVQGDGRGNEVHGRFNEVPARPPVILPEMDFFPGKPITISVLTDIADADIRYTLDGSDATATSTKYTGPFDLKEKAIVSVRVMADGLPAPLTEWREYGDPPPPDPYKAHVFLSDLKPTKAVSGWNGKPRNDKSIEDNPLSVCGQKYDKGIGTHAVSELVYPIKPEYKRFVSICGLDDENNGGTILFAVKIDDKLVAKSEVMNKGSKPWKVSVPITAGSKQVVLIVGDAGDGIGNDHADWVNAGFQLTE